MVYDETSKTFKPELVWTKVMNTDNSAQDNQLKFKTNYTLLVSRQDGAGEGRGQVANFWLDDPYNPILGGASYLLAGAASTAALVLTTLA